MQKVLPKTHSEKVLRIEEVAERMREKFKKSGRSPAIDDEIKQARNRFHEAGGKW